MRVYFSLVYRVRPFSCTYRPRQYWVEAASIAEAAEKITSDYWRDPWVWNHVGYEIDIYLSAWDGQQVLFERYNFYPSMPCSGEKPGNVSDAIWPVDGQDCIVRAGHALVGDYWRPHFKKAPW